MSLIINRIILIVFVLLLLLGCQNNNMCEGKIECRYSNSILYIIKNGKIIQEYSSKGIFVDDSYRPAFALYDCALYINVFNKSIDKLSFKDGKIDPFLRIDTGKFKHNEKIELNANKKGLWIKSNRNLVLVSKETAEIKASYIDSIFIRNPELIDRVSGFWDYSIQNNSVKIMLQYKGSSDSILQKNYFFNLP